MSYDDYEKSVDDGAPVELYAFNSEVYDFYFTNNHVPVTFGGNVYEPMQINRSDINISGVIVSPETMDVTVPRDTEIGDKYGKAFSPPDMSLRIFRRHRQEADYKKIFVGITVMFNHRSSDLFVISCVPRIQMLLNRQMSANRYANKCNHDLFDNRCKVVRDDFTWETTIADIVGPSNQYIEVANDHNVNGRLKFGDVIINGEYRMILNNTDDVIKVRYPFTEIEIGDPVVLVAGCAKTKPACIEFDNFVNYGGFPLQPKKNVVKYTEPGFKDIIALQVNP